MRHNLNSLYAKKRKRKRKRFDIVKKDYANIVENLGTLLKNRNIIAE